MKKIGTRRLPPGKSTTTSNSVLNSPVTAHRPSVGSTFAKATYLALQTRNFELSTDCLMCFSHVFLNWPWNFAGSQLGAIQKETSTVSSTISEQLSARESIPTQKMASFRTQVTVFLILISLAFCASLMIELNLLALVSDPIFEGSRSRRSSYHYSFNIAVIKWVFTNLTSRSPNFCYIDDTSALSTYFWKDYFHPTWKQHQFIASDIYDFLIESSA